MKLAHVADKKTNENAQIPSRDETKALPFINIFMVQVRPLFFSFFLPRGLSATGPPGFLLDDNPRIMIIVFLHTALLVLILKRGKSIH